MNYKSILVILAFNLGVQEIAFATDNFCVGQVENLIIRSDGGVQINADWRGDYTQICSLNSEWKGVSVINCSMWVALIESARKQKRPVSTWYPSNVFSSCTQIPTYQDAPAPGYVGH